MSHAAPVGPRQRPPLRARRAFVPAGMISQLGPQRFQPVARLRLSQEADTMRKHLAIILAALSLSTLSGVAATQKPSTKLGMLDCVIEGGTGYIIGSTKNLA